MISEAVSGYLSLSFHRYLAINLTVFQKIGRIEGRLAGRPTSKRGRIGCCELPRSMFSIHVFIDYTMAVSCSALFSQWDWMHPRVVHGKLRLFLMLLGHQKKQMQIRLHNSSTEALRFSADRILDGGKRSKWFEGNDSLIRILKWARFCCIRISTDQIYIILCITMN